MEFLASASTLPTSEMVLPKATLLNGGIKSGSLPMLFTARGISPLDTSWHPSKICAPRSISLSGTGSTYTQPTCNPGTSLVTWQLRTLADLAGTVSQQLPVITGADPTDLVGLLLTELPAANTVAVRPQLSSRVFDSVLKTFTISLKVYTKPFSTFLLYGKDVPWDW